MLRSILITAVSSVALTGIASAQDGNFNAGAGYSNVEIGDAQFDAISLRAGYDFNETFGVEGQLDFGIGDDSLTLGAVTADVELNYSAGFYGIARLPVAENANLFGRLGYVTTEVEGSIAGFVADESDDGFSFGVGGEYYFDNANGVRVEYTRTDYDDGEGDTFGISWVHRFGG
jgi:outer membrane immunogenic protein